MARQPQVKARYWTGVLYPENMVDGWQDRIADLVQMPFAYCVHSKDTDQKSEHRKDHVHLMLAFPNTTTYSHALRVFKQLGAKSVNKVEQVINVRRCYDYLIHDTDQCRKEGKYQYDRSERICGNNFDIGCYEQLSTADKQAMLREMANYIVENDVRDLSTLYIEFEKLSESAYFEVFSSYSAMLERLCKGNFHRYERYRS